MNSTDMPTVEDMQSAFGIVPTDVSESLEATDTTTVDTSSETSGTEVNQMSENETPPGSDANVETQTQAQNTQVMNANANVEKQNQAFARMRTENAQLQKTLLTVAQVLGVDTKQPMDQLASKVQTQAINAIAKANNMDPAILQRLDHLEAINAEYTKMKAQTEITASLNTIKEKYGASDEDVTSFVQELCNDGYSIDTQGTNLELEFIRRNYETIQKRAVDKAIQAEQTRATKGSGASQPSTKQGQDDNSEAHNIDTVEGLNKFFAEALK